MTSRNWEAQVDVNTREKVFMERAGMVVLLIASGALGTFPEKLIVAQEPPASLRLEPNPKVGIASLKICLRLQDDTPFLGTVSVRVMPSEGYEILGTPDKTPGDFLFSEVTPGKYFVEVNAPGYLAARLSTQVEPGHRQKTMFVAMKPRLVSKEVGNSDSAEATSMLRTKAESMFSTGITPALGTGTQRDFWRAHELEEMVPPVDASVPCPTQEILQGVGQRMAEFVGTLEKFTATETIEHYQINQAGERKGPETRRFEYVVVVTHGEGRKFFVEEFRNGSTEIEQFPAHIATQGLPAIALIFHPLLTTDFDFRCEGMGQWKGQEAWQIHFVQRADRPVRIRSYYVGAHLYPVQLEGRVWIDPGNDQVVRVESELAIPIPDIDLKSERLMIEYGPVQFRSTGQQLWLPYFAELYVERQGKRYYRRHSFADFQLFNVDTTQSMQAPKGSYSFTNASDRDVNGQLTVIPQEGTNRESVTLRFTIPARGRVFKIVGPGKDVNLPVTAVAAATFVHNGEAGSVKVDVFLVKETTLDVVPETPVPENP